VDDRKRWLRIAMRRELSALDSVAAVNAGRAISEHVCETSIWREASTVALFSTLPGEVETTPLIQRARRDGKQTLFPRMVSGPALEFARVEGSECLKRGRYGVREPSSRCAVQRLTSEVLVFVPGLAFDRGGGRLGRGAGYYDRTFADRDSTRGRPRLIGAGFALQLVESVPVDSVDIRMDHVVTEAGFLRAV